MCTAYTMQIELQEGQAIVNSIVSAFMSKLTHQSRKLPHAVLSFYPLFHSLLPSILFPALCWPSPSRFVVGVHLLGMLWLAITNPFHQRFPHTAGLQHDQVKQTKRQAGVRRAAVKQGKRGEGGGQPAPDLLCCHGNWRYRSGPVTRPPRLPPPGPWSPKSSSSRVVGFDYERDSVYTS